jgi:hypothetical protein
MRASSTAVLIAMAIAAPRSQAAPAESPTVSYWHVWTDNNGVSHQSRCELHDFVMKTLEPPAAPSWQDYVKTAGSDVIISVLPPGWVGLWHENPKPQWIIPLSGRWFVETTDHKRVEMGPGEISFGEDQNTKPNDQGLKGHLSGALGNTPAVLMIAQTAISPTVNQPCHLK